VVAALGGHADTAQFVTSKQLEVIRHVSAVRGLFRR
jgi:hypothetical protein